MDCEFFTVPEATIYQNLYYMTWPTYTAIFPATIFHINFHIDSPWIQPVLKWLITSSNSWKTSLTICSNTFCFCISYVNTFRINKIILSKVYVNVWERIEEKKSIERMISTRGVNTFTNSHSCLLIIVILHRNIHCDWLTEASPGSIG